MKPIKTTLLLILTTLAYLNIQAQPLTNAEQVKQSMYEATQYMVEEVSTNGGYVWNYLPDFSRRWGEMEAYPTMIWLQHPGTISMGHLFLDVYEYTGEAYYYQAAEKAAAALIWGQHHSGGWNYMVDFAGDRSLKHWYATIGKNGWRLEEFQHYYGNCTFDDDITSDAARFLLRMYLEKLDPKYKPALDKAINFILESQYPLGGWPQRYPLMYDFNKQNHPDYTSFYTFNDDVIWENIHFLIQCYETLGEERFLDPICRGMNFYLISQDVSGGWPQQLDMGLKTAGARTYEPAALLPKTTFRNAMLLMQFYRLTGDKKYMAHIPQAIEWLEKNGLPEAQSDSGRYTHPTFIDPETGKAIYLHRKGSNAIYGHYYMDEKDDHLLGHYSGKGFVPIQVLKDEYTHLMELPPDSVTKDSPLLEQAFSADELPQRFYDLNRIKFDHTPTAEQVREIIKALDDQHRWLTQHAMISNPYSGDGVKTDETLDYGSTFVGDETDTSPYRDPSEQEYISTGTYIRNMLLLLNYLKTIEN